MLARWVRTINVLKTVTPSDVVIQIPLVIIKTEDLIFKDITYTPQAEGNEIILQFYRKSEKETETLK